MMAGSESSAAVSGNSVYDTYPCNYYSFDRLSGKQNWYVNLGCNGGGGDTPVVADGHVFVRDPFAPAHILSAASGAIQGPLGSTAAPAVTGGVAYELSSSTLTAVSDDGLGSPLWSFTGEGDLVAAPIIVGSTVWVGSNAGDLYALNAETGAQLWSTNVGSPIYDSTGGPDGSAGLGAGNGALVVPASDTLVEYVVPPANAAPVNQGAPSVQGETVSGGQLAADVGAWSNVPTAYLYQWQRCNSSRGCANITGATAANYVAGTADVGHTLRVQVTAENATGTSALAFSPPSLAVVS